MVDLLARISRRESGYCQVEHTFDEILTDLEAFSDSMVDGRFKLKPREGAVQIFPQKAAKSLITWMDAR